MASTVSVRIRLDEQAIRALDTDPDVMADVMRAAEGLADDVQAVTPKDSGAGAASIAARPSGLDGAVDVGWDLEHSYLSFPEFGTRYMDAQRFARDALDRYTY